MDLMHSGRFDGFCLVSSDSDFTRLAARIREQRIAVYGFGEQKTPQSLRPACKRFVYTENLTHSDPKSPEATVDAVPVPTAPNLPPMEPVPTINAPLNLLEHIHIARAHGNDKACQDV